MANLATNVITQRYSRTRFGVRINAEIRPVKPALGSASEGNIMTLHMSELSHESASSMQESHIDTRFSTQARQRMFLNDVQSCIERVKNMKNLVDSIDESTDFPSPLCLSQQDSQAQHARDLAAQQGRVVTVTGTPHAVYAHGCIARINAQHNIPASQQLNQNDIHTLITAYLQTNTNCPLAAAAAAYVHAIAAEQSTIPYLEVLQVLPIKEMIKLARITFAMDPVDWTLYLVTDPRMTQRSEESVALQAIEGGVSVVQLRDKYADDSVIEAKAIRLRNALRQSGHANVPIFIDDHVECAARLGCNLHIGQKDMPFVEARKRMPAEWMVGLSCARPDLMHKAYRECKEADVPLPDVIGIGAAFATTTKAHDVPPLGIQGVNEVAKVAHSMGVQTLAIGGIHENTVFPIRDLDIDGVCTVSALMCAEDPAQVARTLKATIVR